MNFKALTCTGHYSLEVDQYPYFARLQCGRGEERIREFSGEAIFQVQGELIAIGIL